ncbi:hypothetical protein BYI23_B011470 [Burkholderia sp. YI23]|nr:hypothetical protein BYI23_B011470 [Burkholderia sp. YI23]
MSIRGEHGEVDAQTVPVGSERVGGAREQLFRKCICHFFCLLASGVLVFVSVRLWNLLCCWFISTAPPRGGGDFLCCCKESHQRKQLCHRPRSHAVWPFFSSGNGPRLKSAPIGPIGLGSRTIRHIAPLNFLVQPFQAPARFAADGSMGYAYGFPRIPGGSA